MFYLVLVQKFVDNSPTAKALFDYDTLDNAYVACYNNMSASMTNDNVKSILCMVIDDNGAVMRLERWERPVEIPEPIDGEPSEDTNELF